MTCPQLSDSGAYVLGALSPAQRSGFERHMATCVDCQAEVNDLAVLPGLLGRIDESMVMAVAEPLPPTVLPGILRRVHRKRRGRRLVAAVAGFAVACLALVAGLAMPSLDGTSAPVVSWHAMTPVSATVPVTAQVAFETVNGGTRVLLKCQYRDGSSGYEGDEHTFTLVALSHSGAPAQQVASWNATAGHDLTADGMTSWPIHQMATLELRAADGDPLLIYQMPT